MKRQFVVSSGDTWEWEETPELIKALKVFHSHSLPKLEEPPKKK